MRQYASACVAALVLLILVNMPSSAQDEPPAKGEAGKATVVTDSQNVVASELMGEWVIQPELTKSLTNREPRTEAITFSESSEGTKKICAVMEAMLAQGTSKGGETIAMFESCMRNIYLAGEVEITKGSKPEKFPFALVTWRGNPHVFICRKAGDRDDLESFNLMVARDAKGDNDLLFLGGDFNNSSFRAFQRKKAAAGEDKQE